MVLKETPKLNRDNRIKTAKEVETKSPHLTIRHTRECHELKEYNCKITSEKELTPDQQISYNLILKQQRLKEERIIRRKKKKPIIECKV